MVENVVCVKWIVDVQRQTDQALGKSVRYDQGIFYLFVGFSWNAWSWNSTKWFWNNTDKFIKHVHRIKKRSPHIFLDPSYWNPNIYKKMKGVASWDSDLFPMCGFPPVHCGFPSGLTGGQVGGQAGHCPLAGEWVYTFNHRSLHCQPGWAATTGPSTIQTAGSIFKMSTWAQTFSRVLPVMET